MSVSDRQLLWNVLTKPDHSADLQDLDGPSLERLAVLAEDQEVLLPLADRFLAAPRHSQTVTERVELRRRNHARAVDQLAQVDHALRAAGVPFLMIKGFGYERLQPAGYQRQMDDLDLVLPTTADGWRAAAALLELGYQFLTTTIARRPWGWAVAIVLQDEHERDVELNCAGLIFHSYSVLGWDDQLWADQEKVREVGVPGRRWAAAILIAEMVDRPRLRLRDRLDARAVLSRLDQADLDWLDALSRRCSLDWELAAAKDTETDDVDFEASRALRLRRRMPNAFRAATHVLPLIRRSAGLVEGLRAAGVAFSRDKLGDVLEADEDMDSVSDRTLAWSGRAATALNHRPAKAQLAAGASLPMVPLDIEDDTPRRGTPVGDVVDDVTVYEAGRGLVLDTPIGAFLSVMIPVVTEEQVDQAVAALTGAVQP